MFETVKEVVSLLNGSVSSLIFCVFDEKHNLHHHFRTRSSDNVVPELFPFVEDPSRIRESPLLADAFKTRSPVSLSLDFGEGQQKKIYVLPYEIKKDDWRFACVQVIMDPPCPNFAGASGSCELAEERGCLLLVDSFSIIRSVSSRVPRAFGYASENLIRTPLQNLFAPSDIDVLLACAADTNESITNCTFSGLDGSRRDVEIKKFSAPDKYTLYNICDVSPTHHMDEVSVVTARERRRIGQDLHDSVGQVITGISLLSRSLSNALSRDAHTGSIDAAQISELADEAINQIRQISRGLMPSEIVQHGLFDSLRELARITTEACDVSCRTHFDESALFLDVSTESHLYRIAQEAVNNSVRHAEASRIKITISEINGLHQLEVIDDGIWKEPDEGNSGIGLKTMEYRATAIGGKLFVGGMVQGGTRVACSWEQQNFL